MTQTESQGAPSKYDEQNDQIRRLAPHFKALNEPCPCPGLLNTMHPDLCYRCKRVDEHVDNCLNCGGDGSTVVTYDPDEKPWPFPWLAKLLREILAKGYDSFYASINGHEDTYHIEFTIVDRRVSAECVGIGDTEAAALLAALAQVVK